MVIFLKSKDEQVQVIVKLLIQITNEEKVIVAFIRCDNSGKNHDSQNQIKDNHPKLVCKFEFTAPDSPQQNGKVERRFATLYGRVRAMLNERDFNWPLRHTMWAYASLHATKLDNSLIMPETHLSPVFMYYGHTPAWDDHLHSFGEIAIVKLTAIIKALLDNKGFPAIYLVPSVDHKGDTYVFGTPKQMTALNHVQLCSFNRIMEHSTNWINQKLLLNLQQLQMN
jgi:hypothetical protein